MTRRRGWPRPDLGLPDLMQSPSEVLAELEATGYGLVDEQPIHAEIRLRTGLNRYPAPWVDGLCRALGIPVRGERRSKLDAAEGRLLDPDGLRHAVAGLDEPARRALGAVLAAGGWMKYGALTRLVGDESGDGYLWREVPPSSAVGQLRLRGLLFVGRLPIGRRRWKVAVVPTELRAGLGTILGSAEAGGRVVSVKGAGSGGTKSGLPPDVRAAAERSLAAFCERRARPEWRAEVRVTFAFRARSVTLYEWRPPWTAIFQGTGAPVERWTRLPVAQFRYEPGSGEWLLYWADRNGRWQPYALCADGDDVYRSQDLDILLAEVEEDPTGIFWG